MMRGGVAERFNKRMSLYKALDALRAVDANCTYTQSGAWSAKPLVEEAIKELEAYETNGTGSQELRDVQARQD